MDDILATERRWKDAHEVAEQCWVDLLKSDEHKEVRDMRAECIEKYRSALDQMRLLCRGTEDGQCWNEAEIEINYDECSRRVSRMEAEHSGYMRCEELSRRHQVLGHRFPGELYSLRVAWDNTIGELRGLWGVHDGKNFVMPTERSIRHQYFFPELERFESVEQYTAGARFSGNEYWYVKYAMEDTKQCDIIGNRSYESVLPIWERINGRKRWE